MEIIVNFLQNIYLSGLFIFYLIKYIIHKEQKPNIEFLEVWVGTKCTLKCKYCAHLIPYYKEKVSYDINEVIDDIKIMLNAANINKLSIAGGEPLTHPQLYELFEFILNRDDIKNIQILTNLTIIPNKENLELMLKLKDKKNFSIVCSDYVGQENKTKNIVKFFQQFNFNLEFHFNDKNAFWVNTLVPGGEKTRFINSYRYFKSCYNNPCRTLSKGYFVYCPRGIGVYDIFNIKYNLFDVAKIRKIPHMPVLKSFIEIILNPKYIKSFCYYCRVNKRIILRGADQLN